MIPSAAMKNAILNVCAAALLLLLSASAVAQDATPNFTGKWNLDVAKSECLGITAAFECDAALLSDDAMGTVAPNQEPRVKAFLRTIHSLDQTP